MKKLNKSLPLPPLFHFCSAKTLRSHLVQAKVYLIEGGLLELKKCNKNCCQVSKNVRETGTFQ